MSVLLEPEQAEALSLAAAEPAHGVIAQGVIEGGVIEQGVIQEARRRRRSRRIRAVLAAAAVGLAGVIAWTLAGEPTWAGSTHASSASAGAGEAGGSQPPAFNIRLVPVVTVVGEAGWCEVIEEHGVTGASACGDVPTPSQPFLQIQGSGEAKSRVETQIAVADPRVAAILVGGTRRVPTVALPGLPYGLRGARIVTPRGAALTALDAVGHRIAQQWVQPLRQGTVSSWRYPQAPPHGVCQIRASGVRGLSISGGTVATTLRPFPGQLVGHAFVPCVVIRLRIGREPLKASLLLDAAHPRSSAGVLPNFRPVPGAPGVLAEGGLDAMRAGNAWLVVGQGRGRAQRIGLLGHLTATASTGD